MSIFGGGESETFEVILSARDQGLTSTLRGADSALDATAERVKRLGEAFLIFEGLRKSIDLVKDFGKAAANQQADLAQVNVALKDNGQNVRAWSASTIDALKKRAAASGFALSDETNSFVKLEGATKNNAEALKILGVAQDVSRARHVSLTAVSLALAKGVEGNTTSLARYGIIVPKITTVEDQLKAKHNELTAAGVKQTAALKDQYAAAMAQAKIQDKQATSAAALTQITGASSGASEAYAKSLAGQYDRTKVSIDELEASIGRKLIPTERAALEQVSSWVDALQHSNRVQQDAAQFAHGLGVAWDDTVSVLSTVGPPLLEIANDTSKVVQAAGGIGTILAFGAAWYTASKSISLGATALESVVRFSTPAKAALSTEGAAGALAGRPALAAGGGEAFLSSLGLSSAGRGAATAESEIAGVAGAAERAGPSLAGFGAGLAAAFNPVTAAVVGVGLLAGGLYYLSQQESDAERAAKKTSSAIDLLTGSAQKFNSAGKNLQGDRINTSSDRIQRDQAALAVRQAQATLKDPSLNRDVLQHAQNILTLKEAYNARRIANHAVAGDLVTTKTDVKDQGDAANGTQVAISRLADSLKHQSDLAARSVAPVRALTEVNGQYTNTVGEQITAQNRAAASLANFTANASSQAATLAKTNPSLSNATKLVGEFAAAQGRVPTKAETVFILQHAKADDDVKTITAKVKAFDGKKVQTEVQLTGTSTIVTQVGNLKQLLQGLTNTPWVIPISYSTSGNPPKNPNSGNQGSGGNGGHPGATGMYIAGSYGADDVHVRVTGREAILNPTQIGLVDSGWSVAGALAATGAPTIRRGSGYATGGNPITTFSSAADAAIAKGGSSKKTAAASHAGHGASGQTEEQKAEAAFNANATSFTNSVGGLLASYASDQLHATKKGPLTRDLKQLIAKYASRANQLTGLRADKRFKGFPGAVAAINSELAQDYGTVGGYRGDLQTLLAPAAAAPGSVAYTKKFGGLQLAFHADQSAAARPIPPNLSASARKKAAAAIATAKKAVPGDRKRMIAAVQNRIAELTKLRKRPPKGMLGAILDELDADQQTLAGLYGDQATDDTQAATDASANLFDDTAFTQSLNAAQNLVARDNAIPGYAQYLAGDTSALGSLVSGRVSDIQKLLAGGGINAATADAATQELTSDYGILQGLLPGNSTNAPSADDQAIIAQLQQQLSIQTRSSGLANAALGAFGSSGDIGSGGYANAWSSAQGSGPTFVQNVYTLHPGDPATLAAIADAANAGNGLQQSIPSGRTTVNL